MTLKGYCENLPSVLALFPVLALGCRRIKNEWACCFQNKRSDPVPSSSLASAIPASSIQSIATTLGTSERSILDGVQSSIAAVVSALSQRSGDKGFLSQILQTASATPENAVASAISGGALANPASSFMTGGSQFLSTLFGNKIGPITEAIASKTGLRAAAASTLLALGGHTVLSFLGSKVRDGSITANNLPEFLSRESDALQGMLPPGFHTVGTHKVDVNPVVAQSVQVEKRSSILPWLLALLALAILLGFWWFHSHQPAPVEVTQPPVAAPVPVAPTITSSTGADLGALVGTKVCDGSMLQIPERGVESKLLAFIQDPATKPDKTSWFDFDRLLFDTDSATLQPQSSDQLNSIATILKACPAVRLTIGGYTDNTGDPAHNLKLSQDRASSVVAQLVALGIAPNRMVPKGYGDQHPVGDNSTDEGRALNRRISMLVTAK
jgi:OmpA-OmpF porin, OOP family